MDEYRGASVVFHHDVNHIGVVRAEYTPDRTPVGRVDVRHLGDGLLHLVHIDVSENTRRQGVGSGLLSAAIRRWQQEVEVTSIRAELATAEADLLWASAARQHPEIHFVPEDED